MRVSAFSSRAYAERSQEAGLAYLRRSGRSFPCSSSRQKDGSSPSFKCPLSRHTLAADPLSRHSDDQTVNRLHFVSTPQSPPACPSADLVVGMSVSSRASATRQAMASPSARASTGGTSAVAASAELTPSSPCRGTH